MVAVAQGNAGISIEGGSANCKARNNTISVAGSAKSIRIYSGATGYILCNNATNIAITNSATGAGNFGSATIASGSTSIAVTHNVGYAPDVANIIVVPTKLSSSGKWWISAVSSTTFTISVDADPGAGTAVFGWKVV